MNITYKSLLPLVACAALAGASPAMAQSSGSRTKAPTQTAAPAATTTATGAPKTLVLYDLPSGTPWDKLGFAYGIMLRNLLGHFDAQVDMMPVQQYTAGKLGGYSATFYLGAAYDHQIPAAFLADAVAAPKPVVWFKYNLWQLAWNPTYNFQAATGINLVGLRGLNAVPTPSSPNPGFFDTVKYKNLDFVKYYSYDSVRNIVNADPDIGHVSVDATKATV
ncbi:MAG: papd-like protein, partial [Comamonadaceae bacterium]